MVIHHQTLGGPFSLVVTTPDADGIDLPPVVLPLGVDLRVAVNLGGGGLEDLGLDPLGQTEGVDGPHDARLDGLDGVVLVMDGRGRTGEVVDLVDLQVDGVDDVVADELEAPMPQEVAYVVLAAREEVVEAQDVVTFRDQAVAQMGAEKTGPPRDEDPLHDRPLIFLRGLGYRG